MQYRNHAKEIYTAAVAAVQPATLLPQYLQLKGNLLHTGNQVISLAESNLYVIGAGKAAAAMAQTTEQLLGHFIQAGFISTKYQHTVHLKIIKCMEAAHYLSVGVPTNRNNIVTKKLAGEDSNQ